MSKGRYNKRSDQRTLDMRTKVNRAEQRMALANMGKDGYTRISDWIRHLMLASR